MTDAVRTPDELLGDLPDFPWEPRFVSYDGLRMARQHMFYSDAKARRDLGYASRPYREGIADAIAWFRQAGYLR